MWKAISNYEGIYEINNLGYIKSLPHNRMKSYIYKKTNTKILKPQIGTTGYYQVRLYKYNIGKTYKIHRLVAKTFIPNTNNRLQVNHKNGIKTDNRVENLERVTHKQNATHSMYILGNNQSKPVIQYTKKSVVVKTWGSASDIKRKKGYSQGTISMCCRGERKSAYGYIRKYAIN